MDKTVFLIIDDRTDDDYNNVTVLLTDYVYSTREEADKANVYKNCPGIRLGEVIEVSLI